LKIEYLWKSLRSVIFLIGFYKMDPPEVDLKYSIFNHLGKEQAMKKLSIVIFLVISLALGGCAGMSDTEQRTLSGAAIGTAAGGVIGAIAGDTPIGLAVGAAAGAAGGYLYDHHKKAQKKAHDEAYEKGYEAGKKSQ
jgi:hypothetical protein